MLEGWCDAGFDPCAFWQQTPATFQAAMAGARKRIDREIEAGISMAYNTAAFNYASKTKAGLKPLRHYVKRPGRKMSNAEMLANMRILAQRANRHASQGN